MTAQRKPYTKYSRAFIRRVFQSEKSPAALHTEYGIDPAYVCNIRNGKFHADITAGLTRSNFTQHKLTTAQIDEIISSPESGAAIARRMGFSRAAISYVRAGKHHTRSGNVARARETLAKASA